MRVLDPLRDSISARLREGHPAPLKEARSNFGSPNDYDALLATLRQEPRDSAVVIDLCPFQRLGSRYTLKEAFESIPPDYAVVVSVHEGAALQALDAAGVLMHVPAVVYDRTGTLQRVLIRSGSADTRVSAVLGELEDARTLLHARRMATQRYMIEHLQPRMIEQPYPGSPLFNRDDLVERGGRWHIRMPNRMLVTCYVNLKRAFREPDILLQVAYEVLYRIYGGFSVPAGASLPIDVLVTPNNTALLAASLVQAITGIPVAMIDRLGPIPSATFSASQLSMPLQGRRVALLVDLMGTGSEVDRSLVYMSLSGASVEHLIAVVHMGVARSLMARDIQHRHYLCTPKSELGYLYRSA